MIVTLTLPLTPTPNPYFYQDPSREPDAAPAVAPLLPAAAAAAARRDEADGWEQIGPARGGRRKDNKPAAAALAGQRAAAPAAAAPRQADPVAAALFRCDGCGAMNTHIEEDPEEEGVGYCRACWRKWETAVPEPTPEAPKARAPFRTLILTPNPNRTLALALALALTLTLTLTLTPP